MRQLVLVALLVTTLAPVLAQDAADFVPPTERYGVAWGDSPAVVVDKSGRAPDADQPAGALTYLGQNGGQTIYTFARRGLAVIVEASPLMSDPDTAAEEYERYKAALVSLYGEPVLEDSERPGDVVPPIIDTVWTPGGDLRAVELTLDAVEQDGDLGHFVLVRTVGPDLN